jgi:hypothetical protein
MRTTVRLPIPGKDPRFLVTFHEEGVPWRANFYFVAVSDDAAGIPMQIAIDTNKQTIELTPGAKVEWRHVGFELSQGITWESQEAEVHALQPHEIERVAARYLHWLEAARRFLELEIARGFESLGQVKRQKPAQLTDEWLRLIADEYRTRTAEGQKAITAIAAAHHVKKSTASRWVARAREKEYLPPKGES